MANLFNKMLVSAPKKSKFNLGHEVLKTFNAGKLIPLTWWEGLPGDKFNINVSGIVRAQALIAPMMQREDFKVRIYKVPYRIIANQDDVERAFTGGRDGNYIDFPMIDLDASFMIVGSLYDYLDLPLPYVWDGSSWQFDGNTNNSPRVSPFPFLAYHKIYNDWFRNEDTEEEIVNSSSGFQETFQRLSGIDSRTYLYKYSGTSVSPAYTLDTLHNVGWERDYFTSALKSSQRGMQVEVPLLGSAPVVIEGIEGTIPAAGGNLTVTPQPDDQNNAVLHGPKGITSVTGTQVMKAYANLEGVSGIGAIALRTAMNLQAFLERSNISGYRYIEKIFGFFGVKSSDARLNYAEYLGGGMLPMSVNSVAQTSATGDSTPQANLAGIGTAAGQNFASCSVFCEEHCIIMAVGYIIPRTSYSQGLARKWTRHDYTDYFWEQFQTIGEQEILNQEVYFDFFSDTDLNNNTWAYQSRYAEYKYFPNVIGGDFRTNLSYWHKSRLFDSLPAYNDDFIKCYPSNRVFAVEDDSTMHYLGDFWFDVKAIRPMNKYNQSKIW